MIPDCITCEHELPVPSEITDLIVVPVEWDEMEFHTYSFPTSPALSFDKYSISEDGQLYKEIVETELVRKDGVISVEERSDGIERLDYTGEILFSGLHLDEDYDFFLEFKALFWKGDMKELELEEWEKSDNKARKETQKELQKLVEKQNKKGHSMWKKILLPFYLVLSFIFGLLRWILGFIVKMTWKIEGLFR
jgi:hypothetical protein